MAKATPWLPAGFGSRPGTGGPPVQDSGHRCQLPRLNQHPRPPVGDFTNHRDRRSAHRLRQLQETLLGATGVLAIAAWGSEAEVARGRLGRRPGARGLAGGLWPIGYLGVRDQLIGHRPDAEPMGSRPRAGGKVSRMWPVRTDAACSPASWGPRLITDLTLRTTPDAPPAAGCLRKGPLEALGWPAPLARWLQLTTGVDSTGEPAEPAAAREPKNAFVCSAWPARQREALADQSTEIQGRASAGPDPRPAPRSRRLEALRPWPSRAQRPGWLLAASGCCHMPASCWPRPRPARSYRWCWRPASRPRYAWATAEALPRLPGWRTCAGLCGRHGGYLTVLQQRIVTAVPAWSDAPLTPP